MWHGEGCRGCEALPWIVMKKNRSSAPLIRAVPIKVYWTGVIYSDRWLNAFFVATAEAGLGLVYFTYKFPLLSRPRCLITLLGCGFLITLFNLKTPNYLVCILYSKLQTQLITFILFLLIFSLLLTNKIFYKEQVFHFILHKIQSCLFKRFHCMNTNASNLKDLAIWCN